MPAKRPVVAVNKITGSVLARFESAAEAARACGTQVSTVCNSCGRLSLCKGRIVYRWEDGFTPHEPFRRKWHAPLVAERGGAAVAFYDRADAQARLGICERALRDAIECGYEAKGFRIRQLQRMGELNAGILRGSVRVAVPAAGALLPWEW